MLISTLQYICNYAWCAACLLRFIYNKNTLLSLSCLPHWREPTHITLHVHDLFGQLGLCRLRHEEVQAVGSLLLAVLFVLQLQDKSTMTLVTPHLLYCLTDTHWCKIVSWGEYEKGSYLPWRPDSGSVHPNSHSQMSLKSMMSSLQRCMDCLSLWVSLEKLPMFIDHFADPEKKWLFLKSWWQGERMSTYENFCVYDSPTRILQGLVVRLATQIFEFGLFEIVVAGSRELQCIFMMFMMTGMVGPWLDAIADYIMGLRFLKHVL